MSADAADNNDVWDINNVICHCSSAFCCACNFVTWWNRSDIMTELKTSIWNLTNINEYSE